MKYTEQKFHEYFGSMLDALFRDPTIEIALNVLCSGTETSQKKNVRARLCKIFVCYIIMPITSTLLSSFQSCILRHLGKMIKTFDITRKGYHGSHFKEWRHTNLEGIQPIDICNSVLSRHKERRKFRRYVLKLQRFTAVRRTNYQARPKRI